MQLSPTFKTVFLITLLGIAFGNAIKSEAACPENHFTYITIPTDIPAGYQGKIEYRSLPPNICVKRVPNISPTEDDNFSNVDFIRIVDGTLIPFPGNTNDFRSYEPILGHYNKKGYYPENFDELYLNNAKFYGAHPILIRKNANAALTYDQNSNTYIIEKRIAQNEKRNTYCPEGFSTVGDKLTCYSKRNALRLNIFSRLELINLPNFDNTPNFPGRECPLGYSTAIGLGSRKGICTSLKAMHISSIVRQELWYRNSFKNKVSCPKNTFSTNQGTTCLPKFAAVYCRMDESSLSSFTYKYKTGRHVYYWPWENANTDNDLPINFSDSLGSISTGVVSSESIRTAMNMFSSDFDFLQPSDYEDTDNIPIFHFFTLLTCDKFKTNQGWSQEPLPPSW